MRELSFKQGTTSNTGALVPLGLVQGFSGLSEGTEIEA